MAFAASGRERRGPLVRIMHGVRRAREHERAGVPVLANRARNPGRRQRKPVGGSKREGFNACCGRRDGGKGRRGGCGDGTCPRGSVPLKAGGPEAGRDGIPRDAAEPPGDIPSYVVPSDLLKPGVDVEELADAARVAGGIKSRGAGAVPRGRPAAGHAGARLPTRLPPR